MRILVTTNAAAGHFLPMAATVAELVAIPEVTSHLAVELMT
jgi:hypothetical protein